MRSPAAAGCDRPVPGAGRDASRETAGAKGAYLCARGFARTRRRLGVRGGDPEVIRRHADAALVLLQWSPRQSEQRQSEQQGAPAPVKEERYGR
jgi:hypothetical protein